MSSDQVQTCSGVSSVACEAPASFALWRVHDGGGKHRACAEHLAAITSEVAASVPDWATNPTHTVYVEEIS